MAARRALGLLRGERCFVAGGRGCQRPGHLSGNFCARFFDVENHFQDGSTTTDFIGVPLSKCSGRPLLARARPPTKVDLSQNCHIRAVKKEALLWSALRQRLRSRAEALARVGSSLKIKNGGSSNFVDE